RNGDAAFVDAAIYCDVRVAINNAGRYEHSGAVNHLRTCGSLHVWADFGDFAVLDEDGAMFDSSLRYSQDGCVLNENDRWCVGRSRGGSPNAREGEKACDGKRAN